MKNYSVVVWVFMMSLVATSSSHARNSDFETFWSLASSSTTTYVGISILFKSAVQAAVPDALGVKEGAVKTDAFLDTRALLEEHFEVTFKDDLEAADAIIILAEKWQNN